MEDDLFKKRLTELADKAYKYIQLKKLVPSTERGQKRLDFAQNLLDFANDTLHASKSDPEMDKATTQKQEAVKESDELDMGKNL